jgi:hypothetical protein
MTRLTTGTDVAHWSWAWTLELVVSVHRPGPCTGTSATAKDGVRTPLCTPLETVAVGPSTTDFAVESVTSTYLVLLSAGVVDLVEVARWGGVVDVVVLSRAGASVVVVTNVVDDVRCVTALRRPWRVSGEDVDVNVKTNTSSSSGLDHMTRCALLIEGRVRVMVH